MTGESTYTTVKVDTNGDGVIDVNADNQTWATKQGNYLHEILNEIGETGSTQSTLKPVRVQNYNSAGTATIGSPEEGDVYVPVLLESPTYDLDGNTLTDSRWSYTWDANNRLSKVETRSGSGVLAAKSVKVEFDYDSLGRRIRKRVYIPQTASSPTRTERFVWDGWSCVARLARAESQNYIWGPDLSGTPQGAVEWAACSWCRN